jgi:hypothetical protein
MKIRGKEKALLIPELALIIVMLVATHAFSWTKSADFESGSIGQKAEGSSGFDGAGSRTIFSDESSAQGSKSAKMMWQSGSDGWASTMGSINYPSKLSEGSEVWARGYFYFSSPWSWSCSPVVKVLRGVHVAHSNGSNVGYLSVFADGGGNILLSNEIGDVQLSTGVRFDLDRWQCIEMYTKLSATNPIFRIWKDGNLIYEDTRSKTLSSSSDYADFAYIMSYWNGGSPRDQVQYVDSFVITTDRPSSADNKGNLMVGTGSGGVVPVTDTTPPNVPAGLRALP